MEVHTRIEFGGDALEAGEHQAHELESREAFSGNRTKRVFRLRIRIVESTLASDADLKGDFADFFGREFVVAFQRAQEVPNSGWVLLQQQFWIGGGVPTSRRGGDVMISGIWLPLIPIP